MKHFLRVAIIAGILLIDGTGIVSAQNIRSISSYSFIDYDGIGASNVFESTVIVPVNGRFSALVRGYYDNRKTWNNTIITFGTIVMLGEYNYMELSYGYGHDKVGKHADFMSFDVTREKNRYLATVGLRHRIYPSFSMTTVSPGIRYFITDGFSLWGKIFTSADSNGQYDYATWLEATYSFSDRVTVSSGGTFGNRLYSTQYDNLYYSTEKSPDISFHSYIGKIIWQANRRVSISYLFEAMTRQKTNHDTKNTLVVDIKM